YRTCLPAFVFFFYCSLASRSLPSFPTRRSSDLIHIHPHGNTALLGQVIKDRSEVTPTPHLTRRRKMRLLVDGHRQGAGDVDGDRSEEHTSELQSRFDLVCRLLLEKKK